MDYEKFLVDKQQGEKIELFVLELLSKNYVTARKAKNTNFDIEITRIDNLKLVPPIGVEVKFDRKALQTNNIALEIANTELKQPSGINSTQANIWIFYLSESKVLAIPTLILKDLAEVYADSSVNAGDGNSRIVLIPIQEVNSCFLNISGQPTRNLKKMITQIVSRN